MKYVAILRNSTKQNRIVACVCCSWLNLENYENELLLTGGLCWLFLAEPFKLRKQTVSWSWFVIVINPPKLSSNPENCRSTRFTWDCNKSKAIPVISSNSVFNLFLYNFIFVLILAIINHPLFCFCVIFSLWCFFRPKLFYSFSEIVNWRKLKSKQYHSKLLYCSTTFQQMATL